MRKILYVTGLLAIFLLTSCASMQVRDVLKVFDEQTQNAGEQVKPDFYNLGPDDVIRVSVEQHPEWSGEYIIKPNGKILIPDLGEMLVGGVTKTVLEVNMADYLGQFIKEPKVTIEIVKYASQVIYVLGEVTHPGRISTEGKIITLRDAIVMADLPGRFAQEGNVFVITPSKQNPRKQVVNLDRILYHGELQNNIEIKPGDIVFVPKNFWGKLNDIISIFLSPLSSAKTLTTP